MPRKVEASSESSRKRIDKAYSQAFTGVLRTLEAINNKLNEGRTLTDEELRFLKKSDSIIRTMQLREKEKDEGPTILSEDLKRFLVMYEKEIELTGKISKSEREQIFLDMGYKRCSICGELHEANRECAFIEYRNLTESTNASLDLEESD